MRCATAVIAGVIVAVSTLATTAVVRAQGVLPPTAPPPQGTMEKGEPQRGVLPPGATAPLPPPAAGKDSGGSADKLGTLKELDKSAATVSVLGREGYNFPGLIAAINDGRLDDVPDDRTTRAVVFSIIKGHADFCGPTPADVALNALPYASDLVRQINRDPAAGGLKVLEEIAKGIVKGQREDPLAAMEDFLRKHGVVFQDGIDDARILVNQGSECTAQQQQRFYSNLSRLVMSRSRREPAADDDIKFWALMSPAYRRQHNIPDPAIELARRKTEALKKTALQSCQNSFDRPGFCDCTVRNLDGLKLADEQWHALSNFRAVAALGKDRSDVAQAVRGCF